jgi:uncharacterized membrane protein
MNAILVLTVIFIALMLLVAGKSAGRNLIALFFNFVVIFVFITLITWGLPIIILLPLASLAILMLSIFSSSDDDKTMSLAFRSSLIVVALLFVFALLIQYLGQFQGFSVEDMEDLEGFSLSVGLNYANIAISVLTISMLGAVAEASIAMIVNLRELIEQDEQMTVSQLQAQRTIIGTQILGTAVNTLFFGMLGGSVGLLIWFVRFKYSFAEIINSKILGIDVVNMLLGMLGIMLVIWLSGLLVERDFKKAKIER